MTESWKRTLWHATYGLIVGVIYVVFMYALIDGIATLVNADPFSIAAWWFGSIGMLACGSAITFLALSSDPVSRIRRWYYRRVHDRRTRDRTPRARVVRR